MSISYILLLFSSQLTFCVSSSPPTPFPNNIYPPTPSPLKSTEPAPSPRRHHSPGADDSSTLIVIAVCVSALFLLLLMACFSKLFGIKIFRRSRIPSSNQVDAVDHDPDINGYYSCSVKKYSWHDIERFTNNFSQVIGSGGFSNVYLARFPEEDSSIFCDINGAIKIHVGSDRLNQVFKQELDILLRLCHENIVKLIGYCDDRDEGVLVFEYVPNGTLHEKLHGNGTTGSLNETEKETVTLLPWRNRMAIAFQLAQAIEYLHERCTLHIVHGDIKASNILLDEHLNCKLCDFGSAKMGFSSAVLPSPSPTMNMKKQQVMMMIGSPGYTDPHYLSTGIASTKNDIYSFGVILLELVTGMEAFSPENGQLLTSSMAGSMLEDVADFEATTKVEELVDSRLAGDFDLEEARAMLSISALCLLQSPILRPSATQILNTIKDKISSISFLFSSPHKDSTIVHDFDAIKCLYNDVN